MNKAIIASAAIFLAFAIPSLASAVSAAPVAPAAPAATTEDGQDFAFKHPARTQIVYRIERVKWIIDQRQQDGDFTDRQAAALKTQADGIRGEEQFFSSQHSGRLTTAEVTRLNSELNDLAKRLNV